MNKLLNLYGVKIHSECAFLSFLENSRNEVEAFSSSYLERKIGNLVFSIPADEASKGLNQVVLSLFLPTVGMDWFLGQRLRILKTASQSDQKSEAITQETV